MVSPVWGLLLTAWYGKKATGPGKMFKKPESMATNKTKAKSDGSNEANGQRLSPGLKPNVNPKSPVIEHNLENLFKD